jgi:hypothetical protein
MHEFIYPKNSKTVIVVVGPSPLVRGLNQQSYLVITVGFYHCRFLA